VLACDPLGVVALAVSDTVTSGMNAVPVATPAPMGAALQVSMVTGEPLGVQTKPVGKSFPTTAFPVVMAAKLYPPNPFEAV
jgi:hypothetical protein